MDHWALSGPAGATTQEFTDKAVTQSQMELVRNFDTEVVNALREVHTKLTMPSLLIWGEGDGFFPLAKAKAMLPQFAGPTTFEVVPDAKLLVHEEHPERFAELVQTFLDALSVDQGRAHSAEQR